MFDEGLPDLKLGSFFHLGFDCQFLPFNSWEKSIELKKYLIPDTSFLNLEEPFAQVHMGWNEEGISFLIQSQQAPSKSFFPVISKGDSVEIFLDTRDVKSSGFTTKFCHHFFFLVEPTEGHDRGEITRFRNEDLHELCESTALMLAVTSSSKGYTLKCFIPSHCLFGYDPKEFNRLGFTYRINRLNAPAQHFSVVTEEFPIEQQPALWSSIKLKT
ncbi:hypothetical protein PHSC3_000156 [Chlamydiales bacterium STE3]|nr:hypothetical protein PHSC3_000156 [Chlamydiales bacterium STE3]